MSWEKVAAAGLLSGFVALAADAAPDVLLVTVDTLRADRLGAYGYERDTSPHLDRLMARGVRFTQARTPEPLTAPALASMLTGLEPHEHAASRNGLRVRGDLPSFPRVLKRRGYDTAAFVGNWTLRDELSGLGEHFEEYTEVLNKARWFGFLKGEATAEDLTDRALEWLQERDAERPYLLWVHYVEPHAPYVLQEAFTDQVGRGEAGSKSYRYDTEIAFVDHHIARLLEATDDEDIVVFTADHGESLGEHDYWGHGRHLYEPTLHIPMSVTWPAGLETGTVEAPAMLHDLGATLLALTGHEVPEFLGGYDWSGVLRGEQEADVTRVTRYQAHKGAVQRRDAPQRVRQQGLLEVARLEAGVKEILRVTNLHRWTFDLTADPAELRSSVPLASAATDPLNRWWNEVHAGLELSDELPPPSLDDEDLEALRALGYID